MTNSVLLVIIYRAFFCFARGAEKKSLIKRGAALQKRDAGIPVIVVAAVKETIS